MRSPADFKRAMTVGTEVDTVNHVYPELSGRRRVLRTQTARFCMSLPESHPRFAATPGGSWLDWPKAIECVFDGSSVTITRSDWGDTGPFLTITITKGATT
jgi:hypothetical protein